jgi:MinD-like ATPase involved in chromosome partitioning or flagellar assembly
MTRPDTTWLAEPGLAPWLTPGDAPAAVAAPSKPSLAPAASAPELPEPPRPTQRVSVQIAPVPSQPGRDSTASGTKSGVARPAGSWSPPGHEFSPSALVRDRRARPAQGWRGAAYSLTAGLWNPGLSQHEATRREHIARARTPLAGWHSVTVSSMKGGVGKTTLTAALGLTLAEHRGDRIVALDANPDAGTLADRLTGHVGVTLRDLVDNLDTIASWTDMAHYTSLAGRLQVLASEQDPAMSEAFTREEYEEVLGVLTRFYNIILTDSGTGVVHSAMGGALDSTDTLVLAAAPTLDGASRASKTLDWLEAHGYGELVESAVVALTLDRRSRAVDSEAIREHFGARCHAVVDIPADPHLTVGGRISLDEMRPGSRDAFLELAALVAEQFSWRKP